MNTRLTPSESWATEYGTDWLSTGPIQWYTTKPSEPFGEFAKYGWDVERVNRALHWMLENSFVYHAIYDFVDILLDEAREEFEGSPRNGAEQADSGDP